MKTIAVTMSLVESHGIHDDVLLLARIKHPPGWTEEEAKEKLADYWNAFQAMEPDCDSQFEDFLDNAGFYIVEGPDELILSVN